MVEEKQWKGVYLAKSGPGADCCHVCEYLDNDQLGYICKLNGNYSLGPCPVLYVCDDFNFLPI